MGHPPFVAGVAKTYDGASPVELEGHPSYSYSSRSGIFIDLRRKVLRQVVRNPRVQCLAHAFCLSAWDF
jgi:hypothetical protein